jgi:hypothetical protein
MAHHKKRSRAKKLSYLQRVGAQCGYARAEARLRKQELDEAVPLRERIAMRNLVEYDSKAS